MLTFVVISSTIRTTTEKTIKSVVGGQERFDVLARCLLNLDRWKERLRTDLNFVLYLSHPEEQIALYIQLSKLPYTLKSELDSVITILDIFTKPMDSFFRFVAISFEDLMKSLSETTAIYYLTPDGIPLEEFTAKINQNAELCFVLGSQYDLSEIQEQVLSNLEVVPLSLGKLDYLASHVITIICNQFSLNDD